MRIVADSVTIRRAGRTLLRSVSLAFSDRELVVVAGGNGAGKTLLLKTLAGLVEPTAGTVCLEPANSAPPGILFQEPDAQILGRTVAEDLAIGIPRDHPKPSERVARLLELAGLSDRRDLVCHRLSGGEKRRLTVAAALASEPRLLLLDEPFTYLDYRGVVAALDQLLAVSRLGCGLVVVTHDLDKILAHADRLVLLQEGAVLFDGEPATGVPLASRAGVRCPTSPIDELTWLPEPRDGARLEE